MTAAAYGAPPLGEARGPWDRWPWPHTPIAPPGPAFMPTLCAPRSGADAATDAIMQASSHVLSALAAVLAGASDEQRARLLAAVAKANEGLAALLAAVNAP